MVTKNALAAALFLWAFALILSPPVQAQEPAPTAQQQAEPTPGPDAQDPRLNDGEAPAEGQAEADQPAPTPTPPPLDLVYPFDAAVVEQALADFRQRLSIEEQRLTQEGDNAVGVDDLPLLRQRARAVRDQAAAEVAKLEPTAKEVQNRLTDLGPTPGEEDDPEPAAIADRRAQLRALQDEVKGAVNSLEAVISRADRLIDDAGERRRTFYFDSLLTPAPSPLSAETWSEARRDLGRIADRISRDYRRWSLTTTAKGQFTEVWTILGGAVALALVLLWPGTWLARRNLLRFAVDRQPSLMGRLALAGYRVVMVMLLGGLALGALYGALVWTGLWTLRLEPVWHGIIVAIFLRRITVTTVRALVTPNHPQWRLLPVDNVGAWRLVMLTSLMTLLMAADHVIQALLTQYAASVELKVVVQAVLQGTASVLLLVMTLVAGARVTVKSEEDAPEAEGGPVPTAEEGSAPLPPLSPRRRVVRLLRRVLLWGLRLLPLTLIVMVLSGYLALSLEVTHFALGVFVLVAGYLLVRGMFHSVLYFLAALAAPEAPSNTDEEAQGGAGLTWFWVGVVLDIVLLTGFVPLAMALLGTPWDTILDEMTAAFLVGPKIGTFQLPFSISDILVGSILLSGLLALTRLVQRLLEKRVFPRTNFDVGIRDSFQTITGYVGLAIAVSVAVSYVGVDLSNLAIIAGALSVGIGFGLQSIVNNFVSGLILLFERPVKVGDWIVAGGNEGTVRRISVRSTEIETFERATIIMPNSELISGAVQNWTHRNKIARMTIAVGVSYDSDPDVVRQILLDIAQENRDILRYPAPYVYFADFGASSLDFQLRCYLRDVDTILNTASEVRYAIVRKFRALNIEIPFPQRSITITHDGLGEADLQLIKRSGHGSAAGRIPAGEADGD